MKMGYILIAIGIVCIAAGLFTLRKPAVMAEPSINTDSTQMNTAEKVSSAEKAQAEPTDAEKKGRDFEKYVVCHFPKKYYSIKEWRSDKCVNGHYAESSSYPDLELVLHLGNSEHTFAVECKWRHEFNGNGYVKWCDDSQLERYQEYASSNSWPVFIILGVGGEPSSPDQVYCVPLRAMKFSDAKKSYLEGFKHDTGKDFFYFAKEEELR